MMLKLVVKDAEGQAQTYELPSHHIKFGCLSANEVFLDDKTLEPIEGTLSLKEGNLVFENISESKNIQYQGQVLTEPVTLSEKSEIQIGSFTIVIDSFEQSSVTASQADSDSSERKGERRRRSDLLFSPRVGEVTGDAFEVVSYWDDRVLGVEHFEDFSKTDEQPIYIGSSEKAHFSTNNVRAGSSLYKLCDVAKDTFTLYLTEGMEARVRKDGKYSSLGPGTHTLKKGDLAHVKFFSTRFFFIHKKLPEVKIPVERIEDPLFASLLAAFFLSFIALCSSFYLVGASVLDEKDEKIWAMVQIKKEHDKNKVAFGEVSRERELEKVKSEKEPPPKPVKKDEPKKSAPQNDRFQHMEQYNKSLKKKKSGANVAQKQNNKGARRKGKDKNDKMGVEDGQTKQSSGLNLSLVGLGLGKVSSSDGLGAVSVDAVNASGGAGAGEGSAAKNFGLGGVGSDLGDVDLASLNSGAMNFGAEGNLAGEDLKGFKRKGGSAKVNVRTGDPMIGPGINKEEVWNVLLSANRAINHCYNTLLQRNPKAAGTVSVSIIIGLDGRGTQSVVKHSDISDKKMQSCLLNVIKRLDFPKPQGGREVEFKMPYGFSPQ